MIDGKVWIVFITESHLDDKVSTQDILISGYLEPFRNDRNCFGGGVLIYIADYLHASRRYDMEEPKHIVSKYSILFLTLLAFQWNTVKSPTLLSGPGFSATSLLNKRSCSRKKVNYCRSCLVSKKCLFKSLRFLPYYFLLLIVFFQKTIQTLPSILKVIFIDPFEQNLSFTFFLLQLLLLSNNGSK
jgi:hypothetical protein